MKRTLVPLVAVLVLLALATAWGETVKTRMGWLSFTHDFGNGYDGYLRAEYDYASDTHVVENAPPEISTYGRDIVNASLGLNYQPMQLEVMLWARNLTEDDSIAYVFPTVAQSGSYSGFTNAPRTYGVTVRKRF